MDVLALVMRSCSTWSHNAFVSKHRKNKTKQAQNMNVEFQEMVVMLSMRRRQQRLGGGPNCLGKSKKGMGRGQEKVRFCGKRLLDRIVALGKCVSKIPQGNSDRTAHEQYYVVAKQKKHVKVSCCAVDLAEGLPKGNQPSSSTDSVEKHSALWESVIPERTTWDQRQHSRIEVVMHMRG